MRLASVLRLSRCRSVSDLRDAGVGKIRIKAHSRDDDDDEDEIVCFSVRRKLENYFRLPDQNQELKPMSRVETESGPISRGSQSGLRSVSMARDLRWKGFAKKVSFELKSEGVMDGESGEE